VWIAVALSAGIILTTIHTQDYKDVLGDAAAGRVTLPIAYPALSRVVTAFFLIAWSWGISRTWRLDDVAAAFMGVLALFVGVSFVARTDSRADKVSFYWYNVSHHMCTHHSEFLSYAIFPRCGLALHMSFLDTTGCAWYHDYLWIMRSGPTNSRVLMGSSLIHQITGHRNRLRVSFNGFVVL
jgi:hypothetical protein